MQKTVIITAGGIGKRMGNELPKQFILLKSKPILQYTIEAFYSFDSNIQIIITLPKEWILYWKDLCQKNDFSIPYEVVEGGEERFHSIKNALKISTGELIAVHDGVRPLVSKEIIQNSLLQAQQFGTSIPVIPLKDSIRKQFSNSNRTTSVLRKDFVLVQTPQTFKAELLKQAYSQQFNEEITDDASLVEKLGFEIHTFTGDEKNIKITSPIDLKIAEFLLNEVK